MTTVQDDLLVRLMVLATMEKLLEYLMECPGWVEALR
jgi:hypothetical protein